MPFRELRRHAERAGHGEWDVTGADEAKCAALWIDCAIKTNKTRAWAGITKTTARRRRESPVRHLILLHNRNHMLHNQARRLSYRQWIAWTWILASCCRKVRASNWYRENAKRESEFRWLVHIRSTKLPWKARRGKREEENIYCNRQTQFASRTRGIWTQRAAALFRLAHGYDDHGAIKEERSRNRTTGSRKVCVEAFGFYAVCVQNWIVANILPAKCARSKKTLEMRVIKSPISTANVKRHRRNCQASILRRKIKPSKFVILFFYVVCVLIPFCRIWRWLSLRKTTLSSWN